MQPNSNNNKKADNNDAQSIERAEQHNGTEHRCEKSNAQNTNTVYNVAFHL